MEIERAVHKFCDRKLANAVTGHVKGNVPDIIIIIIFSSSFFLSH